MVYIYTSLDQLKKKKIRSESLNFIVLRVESFFRIQIQ